jgi:hypothetical protein
VSVRAHREGRVKSRVRLPDYVRKAGPHQPRHERRNSKHDAIRRALKEV